MCIRANNQRPYKSVTAPQIGSLPEHTGNFDKKLFHSNIH